MINEQMEIKWNAGYPTHVGWWRTKDAFCDDAWRWWDGKRWSTIALDTYSAQEAAQAANCQRSYLATTIVHWCMYWPKNARVKRINPKTGEVTGGVA